MSQIYNSYINSLLQNVYGGNQSQYGNQNQYGNQSQYGNQHTGQPQGGYGGQYSSLFSLIELLLERRNGGTSGTGGHYPDPGSQNNTAEGDGTLSGEDRTFEWKGTDGNDYMKFRDLEDSKVKVKTDDGADILDIDSSVEDTEIRIYDFEDMDQLRLEGDPGDWDYDVDANTTGSGGVVTFTNDFTDTTVRIKLDDLAALGTYNATAGTYTFDSSILFY